MRQRPIQPVLDDPLDALASQADAASAIDAWLVVFARLMRLPEPVRAEIRAELREHLRERVRDLILAGGAGCDERDAVRIAIEELGETAHLAHRFEQANRPNRRRLLMHATLLLASAGAITAGIFTFAPRSPSMPVARFQDAAAHAAAEPPKSLTDRRITLAGDNTLADTLAHIADLAKLNLLVNWREIEETGVTRDAPVQLSLHDVPAAQALNLIAASVGDRANPLDWRVRDGLIEFGLRHTLDAHDVELLSYNVASTLNSIVSNFNTSPKDAGEQICDLLTSLVEPAQWVDNGGDLAQMRLVGGRLFVQAPARLQTKVAWILDQLPKEEAGEPQANAAGADAAAAGLQDLPLLTRVLAANQSPETAAAEKALRDAKAGLRQIEERFKPGSVQIENAKAAVEAAQAKYDESLRRNTGR